VNVGLILDTSAVLAHVRLERVSAGELIGEVADNGDITGIPALAVLDALSQVTGDDRKRLENLVTGPNRTVAILALQADDLLEVDRVSMLIPGGRGDAHAVMAANKYGVLLATTAPGQLGIGVVVHADDVEELS
jgi:hypothetical protein